MKAIVAVDKNMGIGKEEKLLMYLPGDLKYFKEKTLGKCLIFGRKTFEALPGGKPLPKRDHIILTGNMDFQVEAREGFACDVVHSREEVMELVAEYEAAARTMGEDPDDAVYLCGGAHTYELFMDECSELYITRINHEFDADRFLQSPETMGFILAWESDVQIDEASGIRYVFQKYERG